MIEVNGHGPNYTEVTKTLHISVSYNSNTKSYLFSLHKEKYGPMIWSDSLEEGKIMFKEALREMFIVKTLLSTRENKSMLLKEAAKHAEFKTIACGELEKIDYLRTKKIVANKAVEDYMALVGELNF